MTAVAAGLWSRSIYITNASFIVAFIWIGSMIMWATGGGDSVWRFASLDLFALFYFYRRWSSPEAQHRQFHFLLMCSYLTTTAFYAYQMAVANFAGDAIGMSPWWFKLASNVLFAAELLLVIGYAVLFRRAKANTRKWRSDVENGFAKVAAARRSVSDFLRQRFMRADKR